ncbi:hypothetical protein LINPERHAP2_LOCUS12814 [Linum perenne]
MIFETDALIVTQALQVDTHDLTEFGEIIMSCKVVMARNPGFRVVFCRTEQNMVVGTLTKRSISCVEPCNGETPLDLGFRGFKIIFI